MKYRKSSLPQQASNPCIWCYYERNFASEDEYKKSICFGCDNGYCKFTSAMWKFGRLNAYFRKKGRIKSKMFPCSLDFWRHRERLPF